MRSTLKEAQMAMKKTQAEQKRKRRVSDGLLGKYASIIPDDKSSTTHVRERRASAYGKVKE